MHHIDAVNQNLRAGQEVEVTNKARNTDIREEVGKVVGYIEGIVEIEGEEYPDSIAITALEIGDKHPQRLTRGDSISVKQRRGPRAIRGKSGKFDRYSDVIVDIGGFLHPIVVTSLDLI